METERKDVASKIINASADEIYQAIINPDALASWIAPKGMRAQINQFEPWEGGRYQIRLSYDKPADKEQFAKSSDGSDITQGKFLKLLAGRQVSQSVDFVSDNPDFAGTMIMTYQLVNTGEATLVRITAENVPEGISRKDHLEGIHSTLENLAHYLKD
ncbi:Uncharacterized conserved protein YndB, AHSA1/START domain [Dyadobacter soli]|uniref:Uncharacterized conserved protein YndB, AHSA1/START domain n=1 Tax=Dyadobacter soli TaxID=659014 RepID=A0A1G7MDT6_9BACT|nr:SRPBCC domain-containing protein [Dyadobacter soli]SDF59279.1 Uncharacterized conserved protein YndB, AHSA1/START domain [Dyadobacter soli]